MSSLAAKLDSISVGSERSILFGYVWRTKQNKRYYLCKDDYFVIPEEKGSSLVLCKRVTKGECNGFVCLKCSDMTVFGNLGSVKNIDAMKQAYCIHAKLCSILFDEGKASPSKKTSGQNEIKILKRFPEFISLVHTASSNNKLPGVVVVNSRATKPKCHTCQGKKCIHVNVYIENASNSDEEEELPIKRMPIEEPRSSNTLDPTDKKGKSSNVFGIAINFPPTKDEKVQINKINEVTNLFPEKVMFPLLEPGETCDCGFEYEEVSLGDCESTNVQIHHSKATSDSRNSSLLALYRKTSQCNCTEFYNGSQDKLIRVSATNPNLNRRSADIPLHFVSYDFLFEYHTSVIAGGTTQISFLQGKNDVNLVIRGQETEIPRYVFRKANKIFIHSLNYDKETAWGCNSCPKPLNKKSSKREEDFENVECHISDGINMGTIENEIKGFANREIFDEEVDDKIVKGIEAKERTLVNNIKPRKILQNLCSSGMLPSDLRNTNAKISASKPTPFLILVSNLLERFEKKEAKLPEQYHFAFKRNK